MNIEIFDYHEIRPLEQFGFTHSFWTIHLDTLTYTWAAMGLFFILIVIARRALKKETNPVALLFETIVNFFINTTKEAFGFFEYRYFAFITSLFFFTFFCCIIGLFPFLDEATKDLNTTLALGLSSFCYVQYQKIRVHGLLEYGKEYLQPFFALAPINLIGELAKIASMSFRLFGNILGGGVVFMMLVDFLEKFAHYFFALAAFYLIVWGFLSYFDITLKNKFFSAGMKTISIIIFFLAWAQMFFGVFEGLIQSFVIMMLTLTYLAMGIPAHEEESHRKADQQCLQN